jgi:hypothetical protein
MARVAQTKTFTATDSNGRTYTILQFTNYLDTGVGQEIEGTKFYRTSDGRHVNPVSQGHYEIIGRPGIPLTSNDPDAP